MAVSKNSGYQEVLIRGLLSERNVFDGDGTFPIRTEIVKALGEVGTGDAIIFLESYIGSGPKLRNLFAESAQTYARKGGYVGPEDEPVEDAHEAIAKIKAREAASSK